MKKLITSTTRIWILLGVSVTLTACVDCNCTYDSDCVGDIERRYICDSGASCESGIKNHVGRCTETFQETD